MMDESVTVIPVDTSLPVDNAQRLEALDPLLSVCVTAPAGSGKTELLSQRVLKLLAVADQPEEILAITFTRKAAAEMHHRIIQALHFAVDNECPTEPHRRLTWQLASEALARNASGDWRLLDNPARLKIQTIDSLCASLTRQMPILSNFGAQPRITDQPQQCYRTAVHSFLQQLEGNNPFASDLVVLLAHVDNDMGKVERLLMSLLQRRDQWLLHLGMGGDSSGAKGALESSLQGIISNVLEKLQQAFAPQAAELIPLLDYAGCNLQWAHSDSAICALAGAVELPAVDVNVVDQWQAYADILLTNRSEWRKSVNKNVGFPTETNDGDKQLAKKLKGDFSALLANFSQDQALLDLLVELRNLPTPEYSQQQWALLESLTRLLPLLVSELTVVFQQQGEVDYSQVAMAAAQALGNGLNPTELAMKLDHRLRHILIDEFQDTSSTQHNLLLRLTEGWAEHNAVNAQRPNTLFIVGDGMQSIYGFREANVGLFLDARRRGINGLELRDLPLTVNFRSDPRVVDWVNHTFAQAFPQRENLSRGAVPYEQAQAFKSADDAEVAIYGFASDDSRILEAAKTVELVTEARQKHPGGSIAILVRSRNHLKDIIPALSQAGLQWQATDIDPLASYGPIRDLLTLTRALLNVADRVSWAALLRTPWLGLDNQDLYCLLGGERQRQPVWHAMNDEQVLGVCSKHGRERLKAVSAILQAAFGQRQRMSLRSWIEGIWLSLGGASCISSREIFTYIDDFFDLLESQQQGESLLALAEFEQAVANLYAAPSHNESDLQVMTIHKAKGLEFDTVILPAMGRAARSDDKSLLMWREYIPEHGGASAGLVISPLTASGAEEDKIYTHLRFEQAQTSSLEHTRLFYVAATRAVKQLYILLTSELDTKTGEPKPPASNSLLNSAWTALAPEVQWQLESHNKASEQFGLNFEADADAQSLNRIRADWQAPAWKFTNPLEDYYLKSDYNNAVAEFDLLEREPQRQDLIEDRQQGLLARSIGIVTHAIFELLVKKGDAFWRAMPDVGRLSWLENLLHHQNLHRHFWPRAVDEIERAVNNTLADSRGQWLLADHQESSCELALSSCFKSGVKQRIIDRSFIDENGTRWIIDYKTSRPQEQESKQDFVQRECTLHRAQLADYKLYLSIKTQQEQQQQPIKTALYFTYYPHWEELEL